MIKIRSFVFFLLSFYCDQNIGFSDYSLKQILSTKQSSQVKKRIKILAIDGGGVRGIIPAYILKHLESRLKNKRLAECFDIMAGTSTGGLITLILNVKDDYGRPKHGSSDVYKIYKDLSSQVFQSSFWQRCQSLDGWYKERYSSENLKLLLQRYMGEMSLSDTLTNVIVPSYDLINNKAVFFNTTEARLMPEKNFLAYDVAYATSAAPTYFKPAQIQNHQGDDFVYIDGGIAASNPALNAYLYAVELYGSDCEFVIVSIGTGSKLDSDQYTKSIDSEIYRSGIISWSTDFVSLLMYGASDTVHNQLSQILNKEGKHQYFRFQTNISKKHAALDNMSKQNIEDLEAYAQHIIYDNDQNLSYIASIIEQ